MEPTPEIPTTPAGPDRTTRLLRRVLVVVVAVLGLGLLSVGYIYAFSPSAVRQPISTHFHFRMQLINNGVPVNFADAQFQTPLNTDVCTAALTREPIHFHDQVDQFVHIHWSGMTGGLVLKNYGWNFLGGPDDTLGYRFDQLPKLIKVPIHAKDLPAPPASANFYIYTGDEATYRQRDWKDFIKQDLRDFFAGRPSASVLGRLLPTASAHNGKDHEAELTALNDVLGSVVIFAQVTEPTDQQIKDRFSHLAPLPESSCGG